MAGAYRARQRLRATGILPALVLRRGPHTGRFLIRFSKGSTKIQAELSVTLRENMDRASEKEGKFSENVATLEAKAVNEPIASFLKMKTGIGHHSGDSFKN